MKRIAVIVGVAVVLVLGIFAFAHRPGFAFAHPAGMKMMGHAGMPGMGPGMMGAGAAGCPMVAEATLTPEQQQERAKVFAEHYIKQFLPGHTLEKHPAAETLVRWWARVSEKVASASPPDWGQRGYAPVDLLQRRQ